MKVEFTANPKACPLNFNERVDLKVHGHDCIKSHPEVQLSQIC